MNNSEDGGVLDAKWWSADQTARWLNGNPLPAEFRWWIVRTAEGTREMQRSPVPNALVRPEVPTVAGCGDWLRSSARFVGLFAECHHVILNWAGRFDLPASGAELAAVLARRRDDFARTAEAAQGLLPEHLMRHDTVAFGARRLLVGDERHPWVEAATVAVVTENRCLLFCASAERGEKFMVRVRDNRGFAEGMKIEVLLTDDGRWQAETPPAVAT